MAFRFQPGEDFNAAVPRLLSEQIADARAVLSAPENPVKAVHEARKCIKRARGLLRLVKPNIRAQHYKKHNTALRDIARGLSLQRDRDVMREMLEALGEAASGNAASGNKVGSACKKAMKALQLDPAVPSVEAEQHEKPGATSQKAAKSGPDKASPSANSAGGGSDEAAPEQQKFKVLAKKAISALKKAEADVARMQLPGGSVPENVLDGLTAAYKAGRRMRRKAFAGPEEEPIHDWRKDVQAHWRQMALMSAAWPDFFNARIALARQLSDTLGKDHDLSVLRDAIRDLPARRLSRGERKVLIEAIRKTQDGLRKSARADGAILYAEPAKALARQVQRYWLVAETSGNATGSEGSVAKRKRRRRLETFATLH